MIAMDCEYGQGNVQILATKIRRDALDPKLQFPIAKNIIPQQVQTLEYAFLGRVDLIK